MPTYNIYFQNDYGETQTYAFFTEPPKVESTTGDPKVYSNVWISEKLAGTGGNVTIKTTSDFYAWCGTAERAIAPGVKVSNGHGVPATLGTINSPGSTFTMFNNGGKPSFDGKEEWTANPASYQINTGIDFLPNQNFLIGLGAHDSGGRMVASASIAAPRNAMVNISPVVKFYVAAYSAVQGTAIDYTAVSKNAGVIDFTRGPGRGMFGAIVVQDESGAFQTRYVAQQQYAAAVAAAQGSSPATQGNRVWKEVEYLQKQINEIQTYLSMPNRLVDHFRGTLRWFGDPPITWLAVLNRMQTGLTQMNYTITNSNNEDPILLHIYFEHNSKSIQQATEDWEAVYKTLPLHLLAAVSNQGVISTTLETMEDKKRKAIEYLEGQNLNGVQA